MESFREWLNLIIAFLQSIGQTIRFWDIIDILIIAYLIYRILSVMRRTSAGSVIKGIVLILVIAGLSYMLELTVLTYFINQTLQLGIILLVVLFQPELRKLFEQMGSSRLNILFRKRAKLGNIEKNINSVVAASMEMAKSKTGAIIVLEREVGLNDYAVTGTRIDADISSELIQNIFYKNSPLHDGALLIRDDRLLAASCMLPLSNNISIGRDIGMRHRAAIGISERSDALSVIISEQTGTISVAVDGMLKRHLAKDTFEALLRNELNPGKSKKEKIKKQKQKVKK